MVKLKRLKPYSINNILFQVGVGEVIGIHQTTACKTIWDVCQKITEKADRWIQFPNSIEDMKRAQVLW